MLYLFSPETITSQRKCKIQAPRIIPGFKVICQIYPDLRRRLRAGQVVISFGVPRTENPPKYQRVFDALQRDIRSGRLKAGDRLPSEAELERLFGTSRITVGRAVRDLQLAGLVERRAGSGSYVKPRGRSDALSF